MSTEAMTVALAGNWLEQTPAAVMSNASVTYSNAQSLSAQNTGMAFGGDVSTTMQWSNNLGYWDGLCWHYPQWWVWPQPLYQPYYVPVTTYVNLNGLQKVRLKSGDVERLRKAASRDAKLKAILNKFTPLIEVELEF